jgi:general secretion pathway protein D
MLPSAARVKSSLTQAGRLIIGMCAVGVLLSCASQRSPVNKDITPEISKQGLVLPEPLREKRTVEADNQAVLEGQQGQNAQTRTTEFKSTPQSAGGKTQVIGDKAGSQFDSITGDSVQVNLSGLTVAAFIDEVFGNILKQSYEIDSALQQKTDLVTLRIEGEQEPAALAKMAVQVLARYGIESSTVGGITRFSLSTNPQGNGGEPPLLISGSALPEVPSSHRTVFQYVPIKVVDVRYAQRWLMMAYEGLGVKVDFDPDGNGLILMGSQPKVRQLAEAVKLFDQPAFQGQNSISIAPVYLTVKELEAQLAQVLDAQGYKVSKGARGGSIILIPLDAAHRVIAFAADRSVLANVKAWAAELDQAPHTADSAGLFVYKMQNTQAEEVASVLNQLYGGGGSGDSGTSVKDDAPKNSGVGVFRNTSTSNMGATGDASTGSASSGAHFVVDKVRNSIIYKGSAAEWARLLIIIKEMDVPPKQVLIQVTIAEVTLSDNFALGIEGFAQEVGLKGKKTSFSTEGGLGELPASGLFTFVNSAGDVRAKLSAYAGESRVRLISTPSVLVKSGSAATVNVSTQFSVVTGDTVSDEVTNGSSGSRQSYSYIEAGTVLSVTPTIHAGNRVELEISQEVSEPGTADGSGNPPISTRSVQTVLSLKDGGSVLLGGLIRTKRSDGETSVPVLGKIPLLGHLFRANSDNKERTELLIMVVPYVLNDSDEAESITTQFRDQLSIESIGTESEVNEAEAISP